MTCKVIGDSCLDLTDELKKNPRFQMIPLTLRIESMLVVDDETFDQRKFMDLVKACPEYPRTTCPSPETFEKTCEEADAEEVFVIAPSGHLSGSYNSAELTRELFEEERAEKGHRDQERRVTTVDPLSASSGESNIAIYTQALCEAGLEFDQVLEKALACRGSIETYFVLESLDTLRKSGRLSGLQTFFATALNIKPVMGADSGTIIKLDQTRGINKAAQRMYDIAVREAENAVDKIAVVCHVNHPQWTEYMESELEKRGTSKDIVVIAATGVATVYANDGGIILAI